MTQAVVAKTTLTKIRHLQSDINQVEKSIVATDLSGPSQEALENFRDTLTNDLLPLLRANADVLESFNEELDDLGEAVEELIEGEGDIIHSTLSAMILSVIQIGNDICDMITSDKTDDLSARKLGALIKAFRQESFDAAKEVLSVTVTEDDEDDADNKPTGDDDDNTGDDGDDGDDGDTTEAEEGETTEA